MWKYPIWGSFCVSNKNIIAFNDMDKEKFDPFGGKIVVKGAREHNLKNIDVVLPRNKFIVFTGLSGSGKSTLAFDTIFF